MPRNGSRPATNAADALLVGRVVDRRAAVPPARPPPCASATAGNASSSSGLELPGRAPSSSRTRGGRVRHPVRPAEAERDRQPHVRRAGLGERRAVDELDHRVDHRLRVHHDVDAGRTATSNSRCASITSRPLLTRVAELIVTTGPMSQVGCASACSGVTSASSSRRPAAERAAAGGQHQPAHLVGACRRAGTGPAPSARSRPARSGPARPTARDQRAAGDQRLLVGQRERAAGVAARPASAPGRASRSCR